MTRMLRRALPGVAAVLACVAAGVAVAAFRATTSSPASSVAADTLAPPTNFAVAWTPGVTASWTASASSWASGHQILRTSKPDGTFAQVGEVTPRTTTTFADAPGAGTFYYRARSFLAGTTWVSADTEIASRQDSTFVFKSSTGFTASGNCDTSAQRERDMQQGFTPTDPEETLARTGGVGTLNFCSDTFPAGQVLSAGRSVVRAYFNNAAGSTCNITATLTRNGTTTLGTGTVTIPNQTALQLYTWSFATAGATFAAGDRLGLHLSWQGVKACDDTFIHYDGAATPSRVTVPSIDGYATSVLAAAGLQSFWRFDETSGTSAADSFGSSPGTHTNGVDVTATGPLGDRSNAAHYDGVDDYTQVGDVYDFAGTAAFSVEFWMRKDVQEATSWSRLVDKHRVSGTRDGWLILVVPDIGGNPGKILFERWSNGVQSSVTSSTVTATGTWYHVVCTYDGATMRLYVNGVLEGTRTSSLSQIDLTQPLRIGASADGGGWFDGAIDGVAIYNVALPESTVRTHYVAR